MLFSPTNRTTCSFTVCVKASDNKNAINELKSDTRAAEAVSAHGTAPQRLFGAQTPQYGEQGIRFRIVPAHNSRLFAGGRTTQRWLSARVCQVTGDSEHEKQLPAVYLLPSAPQPGCDSDASRAGLCATHTQRSREDVLVRRGPGQDLQRLCLLVTSSLGVQQLFCCFQHEQKESEAAETEPLWTRNH